ncbi:hypothetical protein HD806DRAFT_531087 [Xylariaceae sp. AK1471]|nr:hypothetical protein HD806DRAFT_531087 [Xylariaceae sp. AK1471]
MQFSILIVATLMGAVSALPGPAPTITTAPTLKDISVDAVDHHNSTACTSTDCWASYAECNGSLTFLLHSPSLWDGDFSGSVRLSATSYNVSYDSYSLYDSHGFYGSCSFCGFSNFHDFYSFFLKAL